MSVPSTKSVHPAEFTLAMMIVRDANVLITKRIDPKEDPELAEAMMDLAVTMVSIRRDLETEGLTAETSQLLAELQTDRSEDSQ